MKNGIDTEINVEFQKTSNRQELQSGEEIKTLFGKIKKWLSDLKAVAFSGSYNDLSDKPTITDYDDSELKSQTALNRSTLGYQRKNLFDLSSWFKGLGDNKVNGGTIIKTDNGATLSATQNTCYTLKYDIRNIGSGLKIPVNPSTQYVLSFKSNNNLSGTVSIFLNGNINAERPAYNDGSKRKRFTTLSDTTFITVRISNTAGSGSSITYSDIMIRDGEITDDTYEPYKPSVDERLAAIEEKLMALEE